MHLKHLSSILMNLVYILHFLFISVFFLEERYSINLYKLFCNLLIIKIQEKLTIQKKTENKINDRSFNCVYIHGRVLHTGN